MIKIIKMRGDILLRLHSTISRKSSCFANGTYVIKNNVERRTETAHTRFLRRPLGAPVTLRD
jgi:hypothetical protein